MCGSRGLAVVWKVAEWRISVISSGSFVYTFSLAPKGSCSQQENQVTCRDPKETKPVCPAGSPAAFINPVGVRSAKDARPSAARSKDLLGDVRRRGHEPRPSAAVLPRTSGRVPPAAALASSQLVLETNAEISTPLPNLWSSSSLVSVRKAQNSPHTHVHYKDGVTASETLATSRSRTVVLAHDPTNKYTPSSGPSGV